MKKFIWLSVAALCAVALLASACASDTSEQDAAVAAAAAEAASARADAEAARAEAKAAQEDAAAARAEADAAEAEATAAATGSEQDKEAAEAARAEAEAARADAAAAEADAAAAEAAAEAAQADLDRMRSEAEATKGTIAFSYGNETAGIYPIVAGPARLQAEARGYEFIEGAANGDCPKQAPPLSPQNNVQGQKNIPESHRTIL